MEMLFWLLVGHALGDFAWQTDWIAQYKSRHNLPPNTKSQRPNLVWVHVLSAHCLVHAGLVALFTGSIWLGLAEFVAHVIIDFLKSDSRFGFHTDQLLHMGCKVVWVAIAMATGIYASAPILQLI